MPFFGAIKAADAFVRLTVENLMAKQLNIAGTQLKKFAARAIQIGKSIIAVVAAMSAAIAFATKKAGDLVEAVNAVDVIFGKASKSVKNFSDNLFKTLKRSRTETLKAAGQFGAFFTGQGFSQQQAAQLTQQMLQRRTDISSLLNIPEADAARRLLSGLSGEIEPLRRLGVNLRQVAVDQELMRMGIRGGTKAATEQQKTMARMNIIMRQTATAQGDAERTSQTFANQLKELRGVWDETLIRIGVPFQKTGVTVIKMLKSLINFVGDLVTIFSPFIRILTEAFIAFTKFFLAPLGIAIKLLAKFAESLKPVFDLLGGIVKFVSALGGGLGGLIISILGAVTAFRLLADAMIAAQAAGQGGLLARLGGFLGHRAAFPVLAGLGMANFLANQRRKTLSERERVKALQPGFTKAIEQMEKERPGFTELVQLAQRSVQFRDNEETVAARRDLLKRIQKQNLTANQQKLLMIAADMEIKRTGIGDLHDTRMRRTLLEGATLANTEMQGVATIANQLMRAQQTLGDFATQGFLGTTGLGFGMRALAIGAPEDIGNKIDKTNELLTIQNGLLDELELGLQGD